MSCTFLFSRRNHHLCCFLFLFKHVPMTSFECQSPWENFHILIWEILSVTFQGLKIIIEIWETQLLHQDEDPWRIWKSIWLSRLLHLWLFLTFSTRSAENVWNFRKSIFARRKLSSSCKTNFELSFWGRALNLDYQIILKHLALSGLKWI